MRAFNLRLALVLALIAVAGCSTTPQKIETAKAIVVNATSPQLDRFTDSRPDDHRKAREFSEGAEAHLILDDGAFMPPLAESISRLLRAEFLELQPKAIVLTKAYVGAVKISPSRGSGGYRGTPYIAPGTPPGAAALGILLGEGLILLAESARANNNSREAWSAELAIEIDGDPIYSLNRRVRSADTTAAAVLPELLQAAVKDIAEKYRFRIDKQKSEVETPK